MKIADRLSKLEAVTVTRDDSEAEVVRLRAFLTSRLAGIAERRRGIAHPRTTPEQMADLRARLAARLAACCPQVPA